MDFLRKLFGKRQPAVAKPASSEVEFYQYDMNSIPKTYGLCSDRECPCPETRIPKGSGYLYISQEAVVFMKAKKEGRAGGGFVFGPMPILVCEQGAKLRGIDLKVAADDAKRWWETGKVPLRPTPMASRKRQEPGGETVAIDASTAERIGKTLSGLSAEYGKFGFPAPSSIMADAKAMLSAKEAPGARDKVVVDRALIERACNQLQELSRLAKMVGRLETASEFDNHVKILRSALDQ